MFASIPNYGEYLMLSGDNFCFVAKRPKRANDEATGSVCVWAFTLAPDCFYEHWIDWWWQNIIHFRLALSVKREHIIDWSHFVKMISYSFFFTMHSLFNIVTTRYHKCRNWVNGSNIMSLKNCYEKTIQNPRCAFHQNPFTRKTILTNRDSSVCSYSTRSFVISIRLVAIVRWMNFVLCAPICFG